MRIRKIVEKRLRCQMHISTLKTYLKAGVVPKGLRISVKPAITNMSPADNVAWNEVLLNASFGLVRIVIRHNESVLKSLCNQERQLISHHKLSSHESEQLAEYQRKKSMEIGAIKRKKLLRDKVMAPHLPLEMPATVLPLTSNNTSNITPIDG